MARRVASQGACYKGRRHLSIGPGLDAKITKSQSQEAAADPTPQLCFKPLEDRNLLKLMSLDSSCPFFLSDKSNWGLSGLPNANAKSPRFSYAISQIARLPPVAALNRNSTSQIAARYAAFWHAISQIALASFLECP